MCLLAPRLVAVPPSISNIRCRRCRENSKQNHKASCSKSGKSKNATENANAKSNGTEKAKKCNFQRCIFSVAFFLQLATLHFLRCIFCNFDQRLHFFTKKNEKKKQKNATAPKRMQRKMRKKRQLPTLHFLSCIFFNLRRRIFLDDFFLFETCDIAFSKFVCIWKAPPTSNTFRGWQTEKNHSQKNAVPRHGLEPASRIFHSSGQGKKETPRLLF